MRRMICGALVLLAAACATTQSQAPAAPQAQGAALQGEMHTNMQPAADPEGAVKAFDHKPQPGEKALCAVSGESFVVTAETKSVQQDGKWYAFCCDECLPEFQQNPAKFTAH